MDRLTSDDDIFKLDKIPHRGKCVALFGVSSAIIAWAFLSPQTQLVILSVEISLLAGWLAGKIGHGGQAASIRTATEMNAATTSFRNELKSPDSFAKIATTVSAAKDVSDPILRECVFAKLTVLAEELQRLASGQVVFSNTETWRAAYEKVLSDPAITEYRSVSWVKSQDYWQDLPGQQSMRLNYELVGRGVRIERILVIGWNLWPPEMSLPLPRVREWIEEQHYRGLWIGLVRESDLVAEPDLLRDFGIYGGRASGEQETDEESRTVKFVMSFDQPSLRLSRDRWDRLLLFATPYGNLLDQSVADR